MSQVSCWATEKRGICILAKSVSLHVWRELQRLVWELRNLVCMYLGTMQKLFWVLWSAGLVLSEPPCFGGCSDTLPAFSLLKSFPNPRSVSTAWSHILSFYLFVVKWRGVQGKHFKAHSSSTLCFLFHSSFIAGAKSVTPPLKTAFHVLQNTWLEEVDSSLVSRKRSISFFINILENHRIRL